MRAYGSGLLSSIGELKRSIESPLVTRQRLDAQKAANLPFDETKFQPQLFVIDSFQQLYSQTDKLYRLLRAGKLDQVAAGEPGFSRKQLEDFLAIPPPVA